MQIETTQPPAPLSTPLAATFFFSAVPYGCIIAWMKGGAEGVVLGLAATLALWVAGAAFGALVCMLARDIFGRNEGARHLWLKTATAGTLLFSLWCCYKVFF